MQKLCNPNQTVHVMTSIHLFSRHSGIRELLDRIVDVQNTKSAIGSKHHDNISV